MRQIFVVFSEYINFKGPDQENIGLKSKIVLVYVETR
jgi:hypothetical protein